MRRAGYSTGRAAGILCGSGEHDRSRSRRSNEWEASSERSERDDPRREREAPAEGFRETHRATAEYCARLTPVSGTCLLRRFLGSVRLKSDGRDVLSFGGVKSRVQFSPQTTPEASVLGGCNKLPPRRGR